jgi:uncharacterized membrane protein
VAGVRSAPGNAGFNPKGRDDLLSLVFCNGYPALISTAVMFYSPDNCGGEGDNFEMVGWYNIAPGTCMTVVNGDIGGWNEYWYYFAMATDGSVWAGPYGASVPLSAFDQCYGIGVVIEDGDESAEISFRELTVNTDNYTLTFIP